MLVGRGEQPSVQRWRQGPAGLAYAEVLGEIVDEFAEQLEPEDGGLWIHDTDERGIESLKELIADQKR